MASSIIDGRYKEQRLRLTKCGLKTKLYVLEGLSLVLSKYSASTHMSSATLKNSMISSQVEHSMQVIRTRGIDHTISFLAKMHHIVKKNFITSSSDSHSNIEYTKYQTFHESNSKKKIKVVGDIFAYQLKQIQGCSSSTAKAIQNRFGTIRNLIEELKQRGYSNVLEEISMLTKSNTQTKIGLKLAEKICKIFG